MSQNHVCRCAICQREMGWPMIHPTPASFCVDLGKPGGDMTAISVKCPACEILHVLTFEPHTEVQVLGIYCVCGVHFALPTHPKP